MTLHQPLHHIATRFEANPELLGVLHITVGFVTPDEQYSIKISQDGSRLEAGLKEASLLLRDQRGGFELLFAPETPDRAALLSQLQIVPDLERLDYRRLHAGPQP